MEFVKFFTELGQSARIIEEDRRLSSYPQLETRFGRSTHQVFEVVRNWNLSLPQIDVSGHGNRVSYYCVQMGKVLGINDKSLGVLWIAARLHDVGKIVEEVPNQFSDSVYREEERERSNPFQHALIGGRLLDEIGLSSEVTKLVRSHHPNITGVDGGVDLSLLDILRYWDIYDAITSERKGSPSQHPLMAVSSIRQMIAKNELNPLIEGAFYTTIANHVGTYALELPTLWD